MIHIDDGGTPEDGGGEVDRVYHLGGVRGAPVAGPDLPDRAQEFGVLALLRLVRSLDADRPVRVTVVTDDVYDVAGGAGRNPHGASLHGLAQVLPAEYPHLRISCADYGDADSPDQMDGAPGAAARAAVGVDRLVAGIVAEPDDRGGRPVLLRGGERYARELREVPPPMPQRPVFRDNGVYLIVGGTGGVGAALSLDLAERHRAKLVWVSRSAPGPEQQALMAAIRQCGGDVLHVRGDVCRLDDMHHAVAAARARFGVLHGAIHAAMTFIDSPVAAMDVAAFREAMAVKVAGSVNLDEAVGAQPLDFLAFFSSAGSFGATAGNGAYIAASAFEDAFALTVGRRRPYPVRVINWGYWGGVGAGARPGLGGIFRGLGVAPFDGREGLDAVDLVLGGTLPQVMPIRATETALAAMGHRPAAAPLYPTGPPPYPTGFPPESAAPSGSGLGGVRSMLAAGPPTGVDGVLAAHARLDAVCGLALLGVFRRMGTFHRAGEYHHRAELAARLGTVAKFTRLHAALLGILTEAGLLADEGEGVRTRRAVDVVVPPSNPDGLGGGVEAALNLIAREHPEIASTVTVLRLLLRAYPSILRGERDATEVMFPGASMALVEEFYRGNPLTDAFNALVAATVRHRAEQADPGRPLRVLEVGAGTGATTEAVAPVLVPYAERVSYHFTDVSPRFLEHGAERLAARYPFIGFRLLDIEADAVAAGFEPASYDLVLATNVVHATADLRATLRRIRALLRPGGWLVVNELTRVRPIVTVGGGVFDGWWLAADEPLRIPHSPLATPQAWRRLLREEGFGEVVALDHGRAQLGQCVFVAELTEASPVGAFLGDRAQHVDRQAGRTPSYPAPGTLDQSLLRELGAIVQRVLKLDAPPDPARPLSAYGFDSLTGMKVVAGIAEEFGATVPVRLFFEHPTLGEAAQHLLRTGALGGTGAPEGSEKTAVDLRDLAREALRPPTPIAADRTYPLSAGQRALWAIEQTAPGNYAYNLPIAVRLDAGVDVTALRIALQSLVDRHDSLRTTVHLESGGPVQRVAGWRELWFQQVYRAVADDTVVAERAREEVRRPFDLTRGPLLRATLFTSAEDRPVLLLALHHIVIDGVSIGVLLRELADAYGAVLAGRRPAGELPTRDVRRLRGLAARAVGRPAGGAATRLLAGPAAR